MRRTSLLAISLTLLLTTAWIAATGGITRATPPATAPFQRTWERTDKPVAEFGITRTWMWGPEAFSNLMDEEYSEAPNGQRQVQYFDKSRMEDNSYRAVDPWDVTNGLLVVELMTGKLQVGDNSFQQRQPAQVNVGGDADDPTGPTYSTMVQVRTAQPLDAGELITWTLNRAGQLGTAPQDVIDNGVTAETYVPESNHRVASVFWDFMTTEEPVWEDGQLTEDQLFLNPYYATGLPVTEAYWSQIKVGGFYTWVLLQCFERRCLTYTPSNSEGWQVEAGNVGQHYYAWHYGQSTEPPAPTTTQPAVPTPTAPALPTLPAYEFAGSFGEAWDSASAMNAPQGVAVDQDGNVYVADTGNNRIQKYTYAGVFLTEWGEPGAADGQFNNPTGVDVDSNGNVYVTDRDNGRVQIFDADGNWLQTVSSVDTGGQILFGFVWPEDIVIARGYAWVVDSGQQQLMGFPVIGGAGNGIVPGNLILTAPLGVGFDAVNDSVLVADSGSTDIKVYDLQGAWQYTIAGPATAGWLIDVAVSPDGEIYALDRANAKAVVWKKPPGGLWTNAFGGTGSGRGRYSSPSSIVTGAFGGELVIADTGNNRVDRVGDAGTPIDVWSDNRRGRYDTPAGIELLGNDGIYVVDSGLSRIQEVNYDGEFIYEWGAPTTVFGSVDYALQSPSDIAIDEDGDFFVVDTMHHRIIRYDGLGLVPESYPTIWGGAGSDPGQFSFPLRIALDQSGHVYVSDSGNHRIQKFDNDGQFITEWGGFGSQLGSFSDPSGVAMSGDLIYVVDRGNARIQQFDLDGNYTGVSWGSFGSGPGQFNMPEDVVVGPDGNVYVADTGNNRVQAFTPDGQFLRAWGNGYGSGPEQFASPIDITFDWGYGTLMYVTDAGNHRVQILAIP